VKVASHPDNLARPLADPTWRLARVGLEAGPLPQRLFSGLTQVGLPVVCIETRHTNAFLKAQVNKSDRNDARGIARMMRVTDGIAMVRAPISANMHASCELNHSDRGGASAQIRFAKEETKNGSETVINLQGTALMTLAGSE
jgi:transposase